MKARIAVFALLFIAPALSAQQPPPGAADVNPFGRHLFPPELVMAKQFDIGLSDAQREQIRVEVQKAQSQFTDLQWKMAPEGDKLQKLLQADVVDETRVLAQVDQILQFEREIKRRQIALLVRIRNALTPEQRDKLMRIQTRGTE